MNGFWWNFFKVSYSDPTFWFRIFYRIRFWKFWSSAACPNFQRNNRFILWIRSLSLIIT